jgi:RimJ/RimL family protein N-acetyltransferase
MNENISTDRLELSPFNVMGLPVVVQLVEWLNDAETMKYSEQRHKKHSVRSQYDYIDSFHFPSTYLLIKLKNDKLIGTITATVDYHNYVADIGVLIGDRNEWGRGYGGEAWVALTRWLFSGRIRKVTGGAMSRNKGMTSIFIKSGMRMEGLLKDHYLFEGKPTDIELWGKLK